jgi:hypothetical protein
MLLSTRKIDHLYKFLIPACKLNIEKHKKKKIKIEFFKINNSIDFNYLIFFFSNFFNLKMFKKNKCYITYEGINIGKHVVSESLKNFKSYESNLYYYLQILKNFLKAGIILKNCKYYNKKFILDAVYIDHCTYLNGIIFTFFAQKKIPIYHNNYPFSIFKIDFKKTKNSKLFRYENVIKYHQKKNLVNKDIKKCKKILDKITYKKNYLAWMKKIKFVNLENHDFSKYEYVVYAHSFTDGQLGYGNDDFENVYEWLDFTLETLGRLNKKVLIKAHPNFYEKSYGILSYWDKKIFKKIIDKYRTNKKFWFMNKPIFNYDLLKKLDKNCILITHHGTALLEGSYLGFKTISSISTFYGNKYKHSIMWKNKREYSKVLSLNIAKLPKTNIKDLYCLIRNLYFDKYSYYSNNFWEKIISKTIKISPEKFTSSVTIFNLMNENERKKRINYFNLKIKGKEQSIINNMSKNITEIDFKKGKYKYSI